MVARTVPALLVQACAILLMVAARVTFGRRSFHAAADPNRWASGHDWSLPLAAAPDLRRGPVLRVEHRCSTTTLAGARGGSADYHRGGRPHVC